MTTMTIRIITLYQVGQ